MIAKSKRRWRRLPNSSGWWLWREGNRKNAERLLLTADGKMVAEDDEWSKATGLPGITNGIEHNYWSGTNTTQSMMPGMWMRESAT